MTEQGPLDFATAQDEECRLGGVPPRGEAIGLAFSGGGIRSATFNLGVVQALAELHLLRRFDYLSTISGGGYIGAWLSLFIKRYGNGDAAAAEEFLMRRGAKNLEHPAIRFLRSFSNYLTPRLGMSKDTLVAVATYLRNLLLNLAILVTVLSAVLLLPRIGALLANQLQGWPGFHGAYYLVMALLLIAPTYCVAQNLVYRATDSCVHRPRFMRRWTLRLLIDLPLLAAAFLTATWYAQLKWSEVGLGSWIATVAGIYVVLWLLGVGLASASVAEVWSRAKTLISRDKAKWHAAFVFFSLGAGIAGGALLSGVAKGINAIPDVHRPWVALTIGTPAVLAAIMLMVVVHVGLMGRRFAESHRELWSVFGARLMMLSLWWIALSSIAIYGAATIRFLNEWIVGLGGGVWLLSTAFGVLAARSTKTGARGAKGGMEFLTCLAPYVFVVGLLLALSWGLHRTWEQAVLPSATAAEISVPDTNPVAPGTYLRVEPASGSAVVTVRRIESPNLAEQFSAIAAAEYCSIQASFDPWWALPSFILAGVLAAAVLSWRVNINVFSLHHFYRNRLTRCYLGATNKERKPHALTGFDPNDDVPMSDLKGQRPFHIVGTAINLNRGRQLAWQSRRAASFTFSPLHAGYEPASAHVTGGYRPVDEYGQDLDGMAIQLGTAVAISGAAASPNMGYHSSPAVAFLMTVFNVRLGHWCGDPKDKESWRRRDPVLGLRYWFAELTGSADQGHPFVSLSDGGHFENLGIYELVRRRCSLIFACDASADPEYAFDDLAGAMRKCYTDFGVEIRFGDWRPEDIRPRGKNPGTRHCAIAEIIYPGGGPAGTLIYLKASLGEAMPPDITQYGRVNKDFPHETTADQFFDETQFESYRHLGQEVAMRSIRSMRTHGVLPAVLAD